jgi:TetR/AcrR family transcriptional regulator, transcriptional repressor for nem operon
LARAATELRRQDVRDRLLDAGVKALLSSGYAGTSVDEIVKGAGVPKGSFYYYFESKEVLAREAVGRYAEFDEPLREALANGKGKALVRLRRYFEAHLAYFETKQFAHGCLFGNLALELSEDSEVVRKAVETRMREWTGVIAGVLAEARSDGAIGAASDEKILAAYVVNGWEGAVLRMRVERSSAPLKAFLKVTFDRVLKA